MLYIIPNKFDERYVGGKSFVCFLYLILMALRASSSSYHINKARNWIAKPMLVKLTISKKKLLLAMTEVVLILR